MARMPLLLILIVLAACEGCASSGYSDKTVQRAMNYETPENQEPTVMHGTGALSTYSNEGNR